ncbi:MAG: hypothetical protein ACRDPQ_18610 [Nocardioidaceae bacterium]
MSILIGFVVVVAVVTVAVTVMLLVRRRAPEGSFFSDGDRASGVFGVLATGFSVLLGFIIFLAFQSYDESRSGAESEADTVVQMVETAQFLPPDVSTELTGELICYGRSVAGVEWDALAAGNLGDTINPWAVELYRTMQTVEPRTYAEQSAYDRWMDQTGDREQARVDRVHGAEGILPLPLWLVLYLIIGVVFVYMLFFADRGERAKTQALLMGSVAAVITVLMLLLAFFNHPHGDEVGKLQPTAMERSLRLIDAEVDVANLDVTPPCDADGDRLS